MAYITTPFPSDFESDSKKKDKLFGKQVGQAIESQWFENYGLSHRRWWIKQMRAYAKGEQDTNYQRMIEGKKKAEDPKNTKTHKIDYTQKLKILPVFKDILINAIDESLFKPRAEAIDITAVNKKRDYFKKLEETYYTKDIAQAIGEGLGINILPNNVPQDDMELEMQKLDYKPKIEVAQELAIENVMKYEKFEAIKDKMNEDIFDLGFAVGRDYTDFNEGLKLKYVDPFNYIHSSFQIDDGRDIRYHGVLERDTIGNIIKLAGKTTEGENVISGEDLIKIRDYAMGRTDTQSSVEFDMETDANRLCEYLYFVYPVTMSDVYKKRYRNGSVKAIDRTEDGFNPSNPNKKIEIPYTIWFEGIYIPQAQICIKWQEIPNQIVDNLNNPICPFKIYAPKVKRTSETGLVRFDSMVQRAIPLVDDIQRDWYKFQQLKMELRPNTVEIDTQAINNVMLSGEKVKPQTILDLFFGRGVLLKTGSDEDGDPLPSAITEKAGGLNNNALTILSQEFTNNYDRLRQLLGINELRDGTTKPNSKTAVTVQKLLLASSNNATNHVVNASFNLSLDFCRSVSHRLYDILTTTALKDRYMDIIGSDNVELLDAIKEYPMSKFAIYFDFKPDNDERLVFEQSLIDAYNRNEINVAQYNKARQVRNVKSAINYLEYVIKKNKEIQEQDKLRAIQAQAQANAQTSILAEKSKQETATIEYETKKNLTLLEDELKRRGKKEDALIAEYKAQRDHERNMELETVKSFGKQREVEFKENRKDDRVNLQDTNESKKIFQRKNNTEPIDFENQLNSILSNNTLPDNANV